jgi:hypothetical protein
MSEGPDKADGKRRTWGMPVIVSLICGAAFAGGLAARGESAGHVVAAGLLVVCPALAISGIAVLVRRRAR